MTITFRFWSFGVILQLQPPVNFQGEFTTHLGINTAYDIDDFILFKHPYLHYREAHNVLFKNYMLHEEEFHMNCY